jgi:halimadienyl-diphosphate synthase
MVSGFLKSDSDRNTMKSPLEILKSLDHGSATSTVYDTAWVARLKEINPEMSLQALSWVCENQLQDGSWGALEPLYYHDRVVCTLSAMIALTYLGRRSQDKLQIERGLIALEQITSEATRGLSADPNGATVGFEMIAPTLVKEAEQLNIIKQQGDRILGRLARLRESKMSKLAGTKFSRYITVAHSAEMAGTDMVNLLDIENLQESNGSVGNSPAATAYFSLQIKPNDQKAMQYLLDLSQQRNGGYPTLAPFELFEKIWVLWNLSLAGLENKSTETRNAFNENLKYLHENWQKGKGLGLSNTFSIPDSDDTAIGFELLAKNGFKVDIEALLDYEEEKWFRCFRMEANPSVDVNIHALGAFKLSGYSKEHPTIGKIISFVRSKRQNKSYWFDKWHVSPYYTTSHVVICCQGFDDELCKESVDWIINTQRANGSWGFYDFPTAEETAYCIQALCLWRDHGGNIPGGRIELARQWLETHANEQKRSLWIDKSLYCPDLIVESAILSALELSKG